MFLTPNQKRAVETILDKRIDGTPICLDWNQFDLSGVASDPELKEIYSRFCEGEKKDIFLGDATLTDTLVQSELRDAMDRKKAQLLVFAKERATEKMLHECRRLQCKLPGGHEVQEKMQFLEFFKQAGGNAR
jgi:hypothetical protein